jgi:predicted Kef-type K+ transport protein
MDPLWIAIAFVLGFAVKQVGLPPLVGFLAAGFVLNAFGIEGGETLDQIADFGVLLLLFSIGLKLRVKSLFRPEIWAGATLHMLITVVLFGGGLFALSFTGLTYIATLGLYESLLVAFALSFSSTVFAVKILEEQGAMSASYGRIAIGILIMQDILAVIFLTFSSGELPSPWAFTLVLLIFLPQIIKKYPLFSILNKSGHGELLVLLGVLIPLAGALLFIQVGLKPDLGALVFGVLLAGHPKAKELNKALLSFKDLFLVGFFLTIGLSGTPTLEALGISLLLTLAIPIKVAVFFLLLTRFKLRARTATLSSLSLANYSEFGLIVGAAGVANGWLAAEWLLIFALSLSITLIIASPLNMSAQALYSRWQTFLQQFESKTRLPEDEQIELKDAQVIVLGMGRVGTEVYNIMSEKYKQTVLGIDHDKEGIHQHLLAKRNVVHGDVTDLEFWQRIPLTTNIGLIILATSNHLTHLQATKQIKNSYKKVMIAALSRYNDQVEELKEAGVQIVFNLYAEAGVGFAEQTFQVFNNEKYKSDFNLDKAADNK